MATMVLPDPETDGHVSVEQAIAARASRRSFADRPITAGDAGQLLWAAQGITHGRMGVEMRASPSAGATYPLVAFLVVRNGDGLDPGVYRYDPADHALTSVVAADGYEALVRAAGGQDVVRAAPATLVLAANYDRTTREYPAHGERYVHMEAGHAAENVHLACEGRGLATCPVGAFDDAMLSSTLDLPADLAPLYLLPFGYPSGT
ncbi:SagB/ThcOx family dehydrogenase [Halobacteriaceae archaeon GCM10025711]